MSDVMIKVVDNGPYQLKGPVRLTDADGNEYKVDSGKSVFLCRCGNSQTKPFCDGTHVKIGFKASERAVDAAGAVGAG